MKFKVKPEKSNLVLMSSILLFLLVTCILWLILREYVYFTIYLVLTLLIFYVYFFTFYFIKEEYFVTKLGFLKIKIKYENIRSVENLKEGVKLNLKKFSMNIYPHNKDIFVAKLNSKLTNKNSYNIINEK